MENKTKFKPTKNKMFFESSSKMKQTEIGIIPEDWDFDELSKYVNVNMGQSPPSKFYNSKKEGMKFLQGITTFGTKYPTFDTWTTKVTKVSKKGDVLYSVRAPVGEVNIVTEEICIGRGLAALRMKNGTNEFLYYLLKNFQKYIENFASGSVFSAISGKELKLVKLPFPPLPEQRAIAKILSDLDSKIEVLQKQNKTLEKIGQEIFKHWFVDFEFPNEEGKPYKSSGGEMVYNEELGKEIPKGWRVGKLGEIIENFDSKRIPLSSREREKRKGVYPYYGATKIMDYVNDYLFDGTFILMAEDGSVTNEKGFPVLQYVWGKFWANNHTHILRGNGVSTEFVYLLLSKTKISEYVTGAVQPKLNQANMNSIQILIPKSELITKFDDIIQPLFQKKRILFEQIQTLQQIRDSLLPKLMTGKIRVPVEIER